MKIDKGRVVRLYCAFYIFLTFIWWGYEWLTLGRLDSDLFHVGIVVLLSISLTFNVVFRDMLFGKRQKEKQQG